MSIIIRSFQYPKHEEEELNETPVVPTNVNLNSQMVRVTRPTPPNDFVLQRSLTTEKELSIPHSDLLH
ncbi:unnamed protein product [Mucor hiemalis]